MDSEDEFLALSGIQHFAFCKRQWALIHIEQTWQENLLTVQGDLMHDRAHDESLRERRGDTLIIRGLAVRSASLGLMGKCDIVEFHQDEKGHSLYREDGLWRDVPVEYKRGRSKASDADRMQLCAQAMCLEEMFGSDIPVGYLFYGETRSREMVELGASLRDRDQEAAAEMHRLYARRHTPNVKRHPACRSCSLVDLWLPGKSGQASAVAYIAARLGEESL